MSQRPGLIYYVGDILRWYHWMHLFVLCSFRLMTAVVAYGTENQWFWAILRLLAQPGLQRCQVLFGCARNRSQRNRLIEGDKSAIMSDREGQQVRVGDLFGAVQAGTIDDL